MEGKPRAKRVRFLTVTGQLSEGFDDRALSVFEICLPLKISKFTTASY